MKESHQSFCETTRHFIDQTQAKSQTPEIGESSDGYSLAFLPKVTHRNSKRRPFELALSPIRVSVGTVKVLTVCSGQQALDR